MPCDLCALCINIEKKNTSLPLPATLMFSTTKKEIKHYRICILLSIREQQDWSSGNIGRNNSKTHTHIDIYIQERSVNLSNIYFNFSPFMSANKYFGGCTKVIKKIQNFSFKN